MRAFVQRFDFVSLVKYLLIAECHLVEWATANRETLIARCRTRAHKNIHARGAGSPFRGGTVLRFRVVSS